MVRIQKAKSCMNCRFSEKRRADVPCVKCLGLPDHPRWKSRRGSKAGAYRKEGAGRTPFEDRGQLKQTLTLSFTESDITKAGGYKKVQADLEKAFYNTAKQSCMYCEKELKPNEAIIICKECTE